MTDTTVIPTPATPDVCSISLLIDGNEISGEFHVLSASVSNELNRIPSASVQLRDGEASKQTFAASDTDHFVPGQGDRDQARVPAARPRPCSRGSSSSTGCGCASNATLLSLECRDKAVRMTRGLKSRYYTDTTDGDILDELIGQYQLDRDVATTKPSLKEVVQYDATDWDFLRVPGRSQRPRRRRPRRQGHRRAAVDRSRTGRHRPVRRHRARARRRDRRPLAGPRRQGDRLERHRPGTPRGRGVRAVGDRQRQPDRFGAVGRDRRRSAPAAPRRQAQRARAAGVGRCVPAQGPAGQGARTGPVPGLRRGDRRRRGRGHRHR